MKDVADLSENVWILREYEKLSPFEIKDALIALADESAKKSAAVMLNAGRGNPNWTATTPREAFFLLGQWAVQECKRTMDLPDMGGMPERRGIAQRFEAFLSQHRNEPGAKFLSDGVHFAIEKFIFDPDSFVHELADSVIGDNYPSPERFLKHAEQICAEYLMWATCGPRRPRGKFRLFAVEGGTAAICYVFKSLMENRILRKGDNCFATHFQPISRNPPHRLRLTVVNVIADANFIFRMRNWRSLRSGSKNVFHRQSGQPGGVRGRPRCD
jgi:aspartate 4-decarboxylase